jgi:anti-anti-sigma factor
MQISESRQAGVDIVAPAGRIDTTTVAAMEARLAPLLESGGLRLVVDFAAVEYISSAGLRVLLLAARQAKDTGGVMVLCGMGESVRQVFHLAGFVPLFTICETREDAMRRLAAP